MPIPRPRNVRSLGVVLLRRPAKANDAVPLSFDSDGRLGVLFVEQFQADVPQPLLATRAELAS